MSEFPEEDFSWMWNGNDDHNTAIAIGDRTLGEFDNSFEGSRDGRPDLNDAYSENFASDKTLEEFNMDMSFNEDSPIKTSNIGNQEPMIEDQADRNIDQLLEEMSDIDSSKKDDLIPQLKQCCSKSNRKMKQHLEASLDCKRKFEEILGLSPNSSSDEVMSKRAKLLRKARYSLVNQKRNKLNRTTLEIIQETKKKLRGTHSVYICYKCNFTCNTKESFKESKPDQPLLKSYETELSHFICLKCDTGIPPPTKLETRGFLRLNTVERRSVLWPDDDLTPSMSMSDFALLKAYRKNLDQEF